jgi:membrane-associated phospholipid phosphatase
VDYRVYHAVDEFSRDHRWLAHAANGFETFGVTLYAIAVVLLWLATRPGEERRWKVAALAGAASGALALLVNQAIAKAIWDRPRPYESHPGAYHLSSSHDPSFPSDHASAAFGIAFGIFFVAPRVGGVFLAVATLIAIGRVVVGAHYPADVLAGLGVGLVVAALVVRLGRPLLEWLARLLERVSDPVVSPVHRRLRRRGGQPAGDLP